MVSNFVIFYGGICPISIWIFIRDRWNRPFSSQTYLLTAVTRVHYVLLQRIVCNEIRSSNQNVTICKDGQRDKFNLIRRSVKLNNVEGISRLLGTVLTSYYRYFTVKRFRLKHWKYLQNYLSTQTITTLFFVYSKEFSYVVFLGKTKSELFFQQK